MDLASLILTDSGGIQEEAPSMATPVLVMRNDTERYEGLNNHSIKLVGTDAHNIVEQAEIMLDAMRQNSESVPSENPYGDGHASKRIADAIEHLLQKLSTD